MHAVENDTESDLSQEELEDKMEEFMRSQADRESGMYVQAPCLLHMLLCTSPKPGMFCSGGVVASPDLIPDKVIGGDQVSDEVAYHNCPNLSYHARTLRI